MLYFTGIFPGFVIAPSLKRVKESSIDISKLILTSNYKFLLKCVNGLDYFFAIRSWMRSVIVLAKHKMNNDHCVSGN